MKEMYGYDYFERGLEAGLSCYSNYKWLPELTTSLAMAYIDYLKLSRGHNILDFGCSKGFVTKALRLLHRKAWGCDISEYAINSADNETRKYLKIADKKIIPFETNFDFIISKDVFEHIDEKDIDKILSTIYKKSNNLFAIIPLGKDNKYIIPTYNLDKTHILAKDKDWWIDRFKKNGWKLKRFSYNVQGIKESWSNFPNGNGFFLLTK